MVVSRMMVTINAARRRLLGSQLAARLPVSACSGGGGFVAKACRDTGCNGSRFQLSSRRCHNVAATTATTTKSKSAAATTAASSATSTRASGRKAPTTSTGLHNMAKVALSRYNRNAAPGLNRFTGRTHCCGELRASDEGKRVVLCGWLGFKRLLFLLLRDGYGTTQVVIDGERHGKLVESLSLETVICVEGVVQLRPEGQCRSDMATGEVEVHAEEITVLNRADTHLPFIPREYQKKNEQLRMQYRYIDLRHDEMQTNLRLRSHFTHSVRRHLVEQLGFCEVETPTLFRRTPGGAKEFPVACHAFPGHFYSLTQSPQQFKQLLMIGGIDRYFQIARCYRDEGSRPDRQPEFTQVDLEMSFVKMRDVMDAVEDLIRSVWPISLPPSNSFPVIPYREAMSLYGTDKPDVRYSLPLEDVEDILPGLQKEGSLRFDGHVVKMVRLPGGASQVKTQHVDAWRAAAREFGKCAVAKISVGNDCTIPPSMAKHADLSELRKRVSSGDVFVVSWGAERSVQRTLGKVRVDLAELSGAIEGKMFEHHFVWVVDFPLFAVEDGVLSSEHHPFTAPMNEDLSLLQSAPERVRGQHFDLVLNGWEVGGGSIRIHDAQLQLTVLRDLLKEDTTPLNHLLEALARGAPPHGGFALGLDRLLAVFCCAPSIRDVIAFPKSVEGKDLMSGAPAPLSSSDLEFFHLQQLSVSGTGDKGQNQ